MTRRFGCAVCFVRLCLEIVERLCRASWNFKKIIHKSWSLPSNSSAFTDLRGLYGWQVEITTSSNLRLWSKMVGTPSCVIPLNNFNKVYFQALSFLFKLSLNRSSNRHFSLKSLGHFKSSNNNKNVA